MILRLLLWVAPGLALVAALAFGGWLWKDRARLQALDTRHGQCVASVLGKPGSKPLSSVCDPPIATVALAAAQGASCDAALPALAAGAPATCSAAVQKVAADRDARAAEVVDRDVQLAQARRVQAAAVLRASVRATAQAQEAVHAQNVVSQAPLDAAGDRVFDADRLRDLAGPDPAAGGAGGDVHPR